jgi:hypothetical protein
VNHWAIEDFHPVTAYYNQPENHKNMKNQNKHESKLAAVLCVAGLTVPAFGDELQNVTSGAKPQKSQQIQQTQESQVSQTQNSSANTPQEQATPDFNRFNLTGEAGSTGAGGTAAWRFCNHFGISGGGDYFSHTLLNNRTINNVSYSGDMTLQSENVNLRYYPSKTSSFYIGVGALFNQNQVNGSASGGVKINGINYFLPAVTPLLATYEQQPVCPEVTIGGNFFYFDKAHHWALGGELGVFYLGNPKLSLNDTSGIIPPAQLYSYKQQAIDDLKKVPVWPVLKLQITFGF